MRLAILCQVERQTEEVVITLPKVSLVPQFCDKGSCQLARKYQIQVRCRLLPGSGRSRSHASRRLVCGIHARRSRGPWRKVFRTKKHEVVSSYRVCFKQSLCHIRQRQPKLWPVSPMRRPSGPTSIYGVDVWPPWRSFEGDWCAFVGLFGRCRRFAKAPDLRDSFFSAPVV